MSSMNRFLLVAFQHDQTLFVPSWFSSFFFAVFHASFLARCPLITCSHPRHAIRSSTALFALLYVYTQYVSSLPFIFSSPAVVNVSVYS